MNYEEKLDFILKAIFEAKKATPKGSPTKLLTYDINQLLKEELETILKQLQNDYKIITVIETPDKQVEEGSYDGIYEQAGKTYVSDYHYKIEVKEKFDSWYSDYLIRKNSQIINLSDELFEEIYALLYYIKNETDLAQSSEIILNANPQKEIWYIPNQMAKPIRESYDKNLSYLKKMGIVYDFSEDAILQYKVKVNTARLYEELRKIKKRKLANDKQESKSEAPHTAIIENEDELDWPDDFRWEGKYFIFGKYGKIPFNSSDRIHLFKTLTDKKGNWAKISEMRGNKDYGYVRSTIKQITDRFPDEVRKYIEVVSTQDDTSKNKPNVGAYKIKILKKPKPL